MGATEALCNKLENRLYQPIFVPLLTNFFFGMCTLTQTLNSETNNPNQKVVNQCYYIYTKILNTTLIIFWNKYKTIFSNYLSFHTVGGSQKYNNLLESNASSVIKQLDIIGKHLPNNYRCLLVHILKSGGNPKNSKHRYIQYEYICHDYLRSSKRVR